MISRRTWLKSVAACAGAAAAAPVLQAIAQPKTAKRFVFVVRKNGFDGLNLISSDVRAFIQSTGADDPANTFWGLRDYGNTVPEVMPTGELSSVPTLKLLEDHGVGADASVVLGLSARALRRGSGHSGAHGVLSTRRTTGGPGAETLDNYLSRLASVRGAGDLETPFPVLRLGNGPGTLNYGLCASGPGKALPNLLSPELAWDMLFGWAGSGAAADAFRFRARALELIRAQAETDAGGAVGLARQQLSSYRSSLDALVAQQRNLDGFRGRLVTPPIPSEGVVPLDNYRSQMSLVGSALTNGLTNVATVSLGFQNYLYDLPGHPLTATLGQHPLAHGTSGRDPTIAAAEAQAAYREIWRQEIEAVAMLAATLKATPEPTASGGGVSMLDHTVIVFVSDNGEAHHAGARDFPMLLIGGRALGLRTGQTTMYPALKKREPSGPHHREIWHLWNSLLLLCGEEHPEFNGARGRLAAATPTLPEVLA